jgi:steroid 5-alpha reductase family enzyme
VLSLDFVQNVFQFVHLLLAFAVDLLVLLVLRLQALQTLLLPSACQLAVGLDSAQFQSTDWKGLLILLLAGAFGGEGVAG